MPPGIMPDFDSGPRSGHKPVEPSERDRNRVDGRRVAGITCKEQRDRLLQVGQAGTAGSHRKRCDTDGARSITP
jgi:hypothetical protein